MQQKRNQHSWETTGLFSLYSEGLKDEFSVTSLELGERAVFDFLFLWIEHAKVVHIKVIAIVYDFCNRGQQVYLSIYSRHRFVYPYMFSEEDHKTELLALML